MGTLVSSFLRLGIIPSTALATFFWRQLHKRNRLTITGARETERTGVSERNARRLYEYERDLRKWESTMRTRSNTTCREIHSYFILLFYFISLTMRCGGGPTHMCVIRNFEFLRRIRILFLFIFVFFFSFIFLLYLLSM